MTLPDKSCRKSYRKGVADALWAVLLTALTAWLFRPGHRDVEIRLAELKGYVRACSDIMRDSAE